MTCDELRPDYVLYAMGTLEDPEKSELRAHVERGCENCTPGVRDARAWVYALGAAEEGPEPSKGLRKRILVAAGGLPDRGWHWATAWQTAGAVALVAMAVVAYTVQRHAAETASFKTETAALRKEVERSGIEAAGLREAVSLLQAPETREVIFGGDKPAPPKGRVFVHPTSGVLLIASNLPAPPPGKTYEMWIIPKAGAPAPAGLFASSADGTAVHLYKTNVSMATTGVIAVTLEPAGGVSAPTSQPIIVAAL